MNAVAQTFLWYVSSSFHFVNFQVYCVFLARVICSLLALSSTSAFWLWKLQRMESSDDRLDDRLVGDWGEATLATELEKLVHNAWEALATVRWEKMVCVLTVETAHRKATTKTTLQSYFVSTSGSSARVLLSTVLDSRFPDVPKAKSDGLEEYPFFVSSLGLKSLSVDTALGSSTSSEDTLIMSSMTPTLVIALYDSCIEELLWS